MRNGSGSFCMTREQARTRVRQLAGAQPLIGDEHIWGAVLDARLGMVHQREWRRILNANADYRMNKVSPTTDANGYVTLTSLTTGTGDTTRHFYRVLVWVVNNYIYKTGTEKEWALGQNQGVAPRVYFLSDTGTESAFMALPVMKNFAYDGVGDFVWVNWTPTPIDQLSADSVNFDFPSGYEDIICAEVAAELVGKENPQLAAQLKALAAEMRTDLLQDVARTVAKARRVEFEDTSAMWAGN